MINLKALGEHIKDLRKRRGATQKELANKLSVSFQAVSSWERGITPPDINNLVSLASYFGVSIDNLLSSDASTPPLYLGVDGGGTKTELVLTDGDGRVYRRILKSGCNPNDIGYSAAEKLLCDGIGEILAEYPTVRSIFCGIAGAATSDNAKKLAAALKRLYRINIEVKNDAFNLFGLYDGADMALISGTGSVAFAKSGCGYKRIGGWGYLFDRAGSAYDIGRDAICLALSDEDSMRAPSVTTKLLLKRIGSRSVSEHIKALYDGGKPYIASFASEVFEGYRLGDESAVEIIDSNAKALASLLESGRQLYGTRGVAIVSGGLFEHYPDIMIKHIEKHTDVELVISDLPPIYGACRQACLMALSETAEGFHDTFKKTYGELL